MKHSYNIASALLGLLALTPAIAEENAPGQILQDMNMFTPDESAPAYKTKVYERFGTEWTADLAYGCWYTKPRIDGILHRAHYALVHAQLNQRLVEDAANGGTWLRVEFSGSWGLDHTTAKDPGTIFSSGSATQSHADVFGPHDAWFPELAIMHYFAGKRACIIGGMVNLTNYFDAVGIVNDSFATFTNTGFVNSAILPLPDSNAGIILQAEFTPRTYGMIAASRTGSPAGYNPFRSGPSGYCVVGEIGHTFEASNITLRIDPFYEFVDGESCPDACDHRRVGVTGSVEWTPSDRVTAFLRTGISNRTELGNSAELSLGSTFKLFPSREDDFLGVAYGLFKGSCAAEGEDYNRREQVAELMYSMQLCDSVKLVPHVRFIHDAAYRSGHSDETLMGVQLIYSF